MRRNGGGGWGETDERHFFGGVLTSVELLTTELQFKYSSFRKKHNKRYSSQ
jgi:hypothetical protein